MDRSAVAGGGFPSARPVAKGSSVTAIDRSEAVSGVAESVIDQMDSLATTADTWDDEAAVLVLAACEQIRKALGSLAYAANQRIMALTAPGQVVQVPGAGQARHEVASKKRHHGDRLALRLAARVADEAYDRETGERLPPAVLCERTALELVAVFGLANTSQQFRAGQVKQRGMKPGEFIDYADGEATVRFVGGVA